jgi:mono/diheme cytochrome c family protein
MTHRPHLALLLAALLSSACGRSAPRESPRASDNPDTSPVQTAVPAPAGRTDTAVAAAPAPAPTGAKDTAGAKAPAQVAAPATTGTSDTTVATAPLRDAYHTAPLDTVDTRTYQGWKYYNLNCSRCHGEDVSGTTIAPHLILSLKPDGAVPTEEVFLTTVCAGRPEKGMPAWCTLGLTPAQIDTIYAYVKGRSDARLHPGRPARRAP